MTKYNLFFILLLVSMLAFIFFMGFSVREIFTFIMQAKENDEPNSGEVLRFLLSPPLIISFIIAVITNFTYRVFGIVMVIKNKTVSDLEKAIWIIGFIIMSFITAIVFLIMAKSRKFSE
jgi:hypothetical protein